MSENTPKTESIKHQLLDFLNTQPDDISEEDILDFILTAQKIKKGQEALRAGHYYSHEQAKEILKKWLE